MTVLGNTSVFFFMQPNEAVQQLPHQPPFRASTSPEVFRFRSTL